MMKNKNYLLEIELESMDNFKNINSLPCSYPRFNYDVKNNEVIRGVYKKFSDLSEKLEFEQTEISSQNEYYHLYEEKISLNPYMPYIYTYFDIFNIEERISEDMVRTIKEARQMVKEFVGRNGAEEILEEIFSKNNISDIKESTLYKGEFFNQRQRTDIRFQLENKYENNSYLKGDSYKLNLYIRFNDSVSLEDLTFDFIFMSYLYQVVFVNLLKQNKFDYIETNIEKFVKTPDYDTKRLYVGEVIVSYSDLTIGVESANLARFNLNG